MAARKEGPIQGYCENGAGHGDSSPGPPCFLCILHRHPELGLQETRTSGIVADYFDPMANIILDH